MPSELDNLRRAPEPNESEILEEELQAANENASEAGESTEPMPIVELENKEARTSLEELLKKAGIVKKEA
jgi:hypothetical protein